MVDSRASPVWLLYNLLRAIQFNVHAVQFFYLGSVRVSIKMGVVWQKWAWSPKFFGALRTHSLKQPPFLNSWIRPCEAASVHP